MGCLKVFKNCYNTGYEKLLSEFSDFSGSLERRKIPKNDFRKLLPSRYPLCEQRTAYKNQTNGSNE